MHRLKNKGSINSTLTSYLTQACIFKCIHSCDILFPASYTCWFNTVRVVDGLTEWIKHCPLISVQWGSDLAIMPGRVVVEHFVVHDE